MIVHLDQDDTFEVASARMIVEPDEDMFDVGQLAYSEKVVVQVKVRGRTYQIDPTADIFATGKDWDAEAMDMEDGSFVTLSYRDRSRAVG